MNVPKKKLAQYHLYFDNFFTSPDLVVHLRKNGLRSIGTIRKSRVNKNEHTFNKKAPRGSYKVNHDKNSGINYISVIGSKQVSLLSTTAGVTPLKPMPRFSKEENKKVERNFPFAIFTYNKNIGCVDLHNYRYNYRYNRVLPSIRGKKCTWVIFIRILQSSIVNATVIWNICRKDGEKQMSTKDLCRQVSKFYLSKSKRADLTLYKCDTRPRHACSFQSCPLRTTKYCIDCKIYYCKHCFAKIHNNIIIIA